jgi:O-antigen ligase
LGFEHRVLAIVLAVTLQVQTTLPLGGGLRVAASDLFLPITMFYIVPWAAFQPSRLEWRMPGIAWWLLAITAVVAVALFIGYRSFDHWSTWALFNKLGGWFALVAYFMIGTAIVRSGGMELRTEFLHIFLVTAVVVACANVLAFPWLLKFYILPFGVEFNRATGGMANSNAFGFLLAVAALLVLAIESRINLYLPPLLSGLWFTASRGAFLAFILGLASLLVMAPRRWVPALRSLAVAALSVAAITALAIAVDPARIAEAKSGHSPLGLLSIERLDPTAATVEERKAQNARALELFVQAPIFGHGLGYFVETTGTTLHNSLLWLLLETGLAGALAFTGFFGVGVWSLYLGRIDPFLLGMVAVSIAFMAMSVTGEFLYQRHLWLLLGMALAAPPATKTRR